MRALLIIFLSFSFSWCFATEKEAVVIEVRKKVKLHKTEVVYPDYFISGGGKMGLDKGALVSVVRRVPVHDPFQNASIGDFRIKVADVEIIHSDREKSVARLVGIDRHRERPMVRYDTVMVGDRLDLTTLRRKVARVEPFLMPESETRTPASIKADSGTVDRKQSQEPRNAVQQKMVPAKALPPKKEELVKP